MVKKKEIQKQVTTILSEVSSIIENPDNWTQCAMAKDENNEPVDIDDPKATKYCLLGALWIVGTESNISNHSFNIAKHTISRTLIDKGKITDPCFFVPEHVEENIESFNDDSETTHEDVINILKEIIAKH